MRSNVFLLKNVMDSRTDPAEVRALDGSRTLGVAASLSALGDAASLDGPLVHSGLGAIVWSGSYAETERGDAARFDDDVRTWARPGWQRLEACCAALATRGLACVFRTHARHVLSDVPSSARFLGEWGGKGFGVLLDPAMMIPDSMRTPGVCEDVLRRFFEGARLPGVVGVVVSGVASTLEGQRAATGVHEGVVDAGVLAGLAGALRVPLVLMDREVDRQLIVLGTQEPTPCPS